MTRPEVSIRPTADLMARRARRRGSRHVARERTPPRRRRFTPARLEGDRFAREDMASFTTLDAATVEFVYYKTVQLRKLTPADVIASLINLIDQVTDLKNQVGQPNRIGRQPDS